MKRFIRGRAWLLVALALCAIGCAEVNYKRVFDGQEDKVKGIRYLDVSPYLIATTTPDGAIDLRLEYLPDSNKKMAVHPRAIAAKVNTTFSFQRGVLTKADSTSDATVVPKAILEAAKKVALALVLDSPGSALAAESVDENARLVPAPLVFKIIVRGDSVFLVGGGSGHPIQITLQDPKVKDKPKANEAKAGGEES